ncbi:MAG: D-alanine--D-alanine ligase, partial [Polyangia bacterium]|nr:D-alanine--D-alanine ligase [Polyangia bacterium]
MRIASEWQRKRIGVLTGGLSAAREASLQTGEAIYQALIDRGYRATRIYVDRDVDIALRQSGVEVAFLALQGRHGEDGCLQGLLEILGIPYTGSGVTASALAMNKVKSREIFRLRNLPTPPYYVLDQSRLDHLLEDHGAFGFPVVVKPCSMGGSIGVSGARNPGELLQACEQARLCDTWARVERYCVGMEVRVAVRDGLPFGAA